MDYYTVPLTQAELAHHGVKGMKWGVRRYQHTDGSLTPAGKARQDYKDAKKELKTARKVYGRTSGFGMEGIRKREAIERKVLDADMKTLSAKAKLNASKAKDAEKAEFKTYTKAMGKNGLPGSSYDRAAGGRSARIYDSLAAEKGKSYADRVVKKVEKQSYTKLAVASTVAAGAAFVSMYSVATS